MYKIIYKVKLLSPVLINSMAGERNTVSSLDYIPASSILGIFANKYIKEKSCNEAHKNDTFKKWFLRDGLKFTNAYITDEKNNVYYPSPLAIQKKRDSINEIYNLFCIKINEKTKPLKFIRFNGDDGDDIYEKSVDRGLNFHHEKDDKTGASKKGVIFHYDYLKEGQIFQGQILGSEEELKNFKKSFENSFIAFIGRSKSSQYGKVEITFDETINEFKNDNKDLDTNKTILTLTSNTIIYNENCFSSTNIDDLKKVLGCIEIEKSFIKTGQVENFVSVWKLRKPSEICFMAGSCFLLKLDKIQKEKLLELEKTGIGERTNEGFGRFKLIKNNNFKLEDEKKEEVELPNYPIPDITRNIIKKIINDSIIQKVKLDAMEDSNKFKPKDKNDLKSKLPSSKSIVSKLEFFAKDIKTEKNYFIDKLKNLRDVAKNNLKASYNDDNITLFDFLDEKNKIDEKIESCIENTSLFELKKELGTNNYKRPNELELYKTYLITFFSTMRKNMKSLEVK